MQFRVFKQVPRIIYGNNSIERVEELLAKELGKGLVVFDSKVSDLVSKLSLFGREISFIEFDATDGEPYTHQVDEFVQGLVGSVPVDFIIGIGGGSTMDVAKSISVCLKNPGESENYQGWDLPRSPGVFKIGIPTIFGSGSEASRTAVLNNGRKKQGINSDYSMFDGIILDPSLSQSIEIKTKFYTAMDCYIHCVESLEGSMINQLSKGYASTALAYCYEYFDNGMKNEELICVGSYYGGVSIVNSEVGICHALSYGLSTEFGFRHGLANCVAFRVLQEYYGDHVLKFEGWLKKYNLKLPEGVCEKVSSAQMQRMIDQTCLMERPLTNALGSDWFSILTPEKIRELYSRM